MTKSSADIDIDIDSYKVNVVLELPALNIEITYPEQYTGTSIYNLTRVRNDYDSRSKQYSMV